MTDGEDAGTTDQNIKLIKWAIDILHNLPEVGKAVVGVVGDRVGAVDGYREGRLVGVPITRKTN